MSGLDAVEVCHMVITCCNLSPVVACDFSFAEVGVARTLRTVYPTYHAPVPAADRNAGVSGARRSSLLCKARVNAGTEAEN